MANFGTKKFGQFWPIFGKFFCPKIGRNENFIMQMAYGNKKLFYKNFLFAIEKGLLGLSSCPEIWGSNPVVLDQICIFYTKLCKCRLFFVSKRSAVGSASELLLLSLR